MCIRDRHVQNSFCSDLPAGFYVPSTERIGPRTDLASMPRVSVSASEFSEDVARTNVDLVRGYKSLQNEF